MYNIPYNNFFIYLHLYLNKDAYYCKIYIDIDISQICCSYLED